jgi:hypothetical protein
MPCSSNGLTPAAQTPNPAFEPICYGCVRQPRRPEEDPSGEFRLGGWVVPSADEAIGQDLQDLFSQPFERLLRHRIE